MTRSASAPERHPVSQTVTHNHGHIHHDHGHDHDHSGNKWRQATSLLQVSAPIRVAGAVLLLIPLWIAVYGMVS